MQIRPYLFLVLLWLPGCELYTQDTYREQYVVEAYLVANRELPRVRVSRTLRFEEEYTFEKAALEKAAVEIRLLDPEGETEQTFDYIAQSKGVYGPVQDHRVRAAGVYELHVALPNGDLVRASTRVPGAFTTVKAPREDFIYQSAEQIQITVEPSFYPGRQTFYIFTVNAGQPIHQNLTPFYRDLVEEQDNDISHYFVNSSGIINEGNYERDENGHIALEVPWLAIAFFGPNAIVANAIDDNMYEFLRSQDIQTGRSTLSPGEIQNVNYNIEGGIGIFGSLASDTNRVGISKPD